MSKNKAIPSEIRQIIKTKAELEWPNDFEMQLHNVEEQSNSFLEFEYLKQNSEANKLLETLFVFVDEKWPDDFTMKLHEFNEQLEAAGKFFEFTYPAIASEVIEDIKARAFLEWQNDFAMCLYQLENQVAAYLALNET